MPTEKQRKGSEPTADDAFEWTDAPGEPDMAGPPGEFVDVGENPPGQTAAGGTPPHPSPAEGEGDETER